MVKRKPSLVQAETTEDERSSKGGFFANWFNASSRTETRDETDYSGDSVGSDSIEDQYPNNTRRGRRGAQLSDSYRSDFDTADEDSLADFDCDIRDRHGKACKYMRVSIELYKQELRRMSWKLLTFRIMVMLMIGWEVH